MKKFGLNYEIHKSLKETNSNIVFFHGLTGNTKRWTTYIDDLKNKHNLILIDLIGHGQSDFPDDIKKASHQNPKQKKLKI